jgi:hypothetical protein
MDKIIFKVSPWIILVLLIAPIIIGMQINREHLFLSCVFSLLSCLVEFTWYWQINQAINKKNSDFSFQTKCFIIGIFLTELSWIGGKLLTHFYTTELERETWFLLKRSSLFLRACLSIGLSISLTIRVKKVLTERSTWFLFLELYTLILAIVSITPLIKEETEFPIDARESPLS